MRRGRGAQASSWVRGPIATNSAARVVALVSLGLATVIVARIGGPTAVGAYALLRVLPGLVAVLAGCGLPTAVAFYLAGPTRDHPRLRPTVVALTVAGSGIGALAWFLAAPLLHRLFFPELDVGLVAAAAAAVATQLPVAVGKNCLQGLQDQRWTNIVTAAEEAAFLPAYALLLMAGLRGERLVLASLVLADIVVATLAWWRLGGRRWVMGGRPDPALARSMAGFGLRGQAGGMLSLLNLRLDFVLLGALAGPGVLGTYAVASKWSELLRLPALAATYVLYPRYARQGRESADGVKRLLPRAALLGALGAFPLALSAVTLLVPLYGRAFHPAVLPALVLLLGLCGEGVACVITAYLFGSGRPGLNSLALAVGVVCTVVLDVLLIPRFHALGAAVASSVAYAASTAALFGFFLLVSRRVSLSPARPDLTATMATEGAA